jgi:hypothetical protein
MSPKSSGDPASPNVAARKGKGKGKGKGGGGGEVKRAAFKNIDRTRFYYTLGERVLEPIKINQADSSLCGPASLMYLTGLHWPAEYQRFVSELYEKGKSRLGGLKISPGQKCKDYSPIQMTAADWVALASIRDSENIIWNYDEADDKIGGITLPSTLEGWLEDVGFSNLENETNLYFTKGEENFREAAQFAAKGFGVCLFVDWRIVDGTPVRGAMEQTFTTPDHWVVLKPNATVQITKDAVDFKVFSWGEEHQAGGLQPLTMENWLQNYYGYVVAHA